VIRLLLPSALAPHPSSLIPHPSGAPSRPKRIADATAADYDVGIGSVIRDSTPLLTEEGWRDAPGWWKELGTQDSALGTQH